MIKIKDEYYVNLSNITVIKFEYHENNGKVMPLFCYEDTSERNNRYGVFLTEDEKAELIKRLDDKQL